MRDREKVLDKRRSALGKPSARVIALRERRAIREYQASGRQVVPASRAEPLDDDNDKALVLADEDEDDEDDVDPEIHRIFEESANIRKICSNPDCLAARMRRGSGGEESNITMRQCSRCKVTTYCSVGSSPVEPWLAC